MPTVDRGWLDQDERGSPPRPHPAQDQPQQAVRWPKASVRTREYAQLMVQGQAFEQQVSTGRQGESNRCERRNDVTHARVEWPATAATSMILPGRDIGEGQPVLCSGLIPRKGAQDNRYARPSYN